MNIRADVYGRASANALIQTIKDKKKDYLSTSDLRALFSVSRVTIYRWARKGLLPQPLYLGNKKVFETEQVINKLKERSGQIECQNQPVPNRMKPVPEQFKNRGKSRNKSEKTEQNTSNMPYVFNK